MMQKEPELFCHLSGCNQWAETFKLLDGELQMLGLAVNGNAITHMQQVSHRELKTNKFLNFRLNLETSLDQSVWQGKIIFVSLETNHLKDLPSKLVTVAVRLFEGELCVILRHTHILSSSVFLSFTFVYLCVCVFAVFLNLALNFFISWHGMDVQIYQAQRSEKLYLGLGYQSSILWCSGLVGLFII